jgi:hypothetical protein
MYRDKKFLNLRRKSKYHNRPTATGGIIYASKLESKYAQDLEFRKKSGEIRDWERQVRIDLKSHDKHICNYYIDFVVYHNDDTVEYCEVKGYETDVWKMKWKLFEAQMNAEQPNAILTIVR